MKELKALLKVKSIVTILLTAVFCYLSIKQIIDGDKFYSIFQIIIAFYFGTQVEKNNKSDISQNL